MTPAPTPSPVDGGAARRNFIGRFDHYCGRVRAIYALKGGDTGMTDWYATEEAARAAVPEAAVTHADWARLS